jgi:hypothetical protein
VVNQIYTQGLLTQMLAKVGAQGQSVNDTIAWAENQIKAYSMM